MEGKYKRRKRRKEKSWQKRREDRKGWGRGRRKEDLGQGKCSEGGVCVVLPRHWDPLVPQIATGSDPLHHPGIASEHHRLWFKIKNYKDRRPWICTSRSLNALCMHLILQPISKKGLERACGIHPLVQIQELRSHCWNQAERKLCSGNQAVKCLPQVLLRPPPASN